MNKFFVALTAVGLLLAAPASANCSEDHKSGMAHESHEAQEHASTHKIEIEHAYSFATAPQQKMGAVFMEIENELDEADTLVSASFDGAETVELHTMAVDDDGVMRMRKLEDGIVVPADGTVVLAPKGLHIMLIGLKEPLKEGTNLSVELSFEKAGKVSLNVPVKKPGAPIDHETHSDHDHH